MDIAELKHEDDGNEGTDAGNGGKTLDPGIVFPALCKFIVHASDLLIEQPKQSETVLPNGLGNGSQREYSQFKLPGSTHPTLGRLGAKIPSSQHTGERVFDARSEPHETDAMSNELTRFA